MGDTSLDRGAKKGLPEDVTEKKEEGYTFREKLGSKLEDPQVGTQVCKKCKRMKSEVTVHQSYFILLGEREGRKEGEKDGEMKRNGVKKGERERGRMNFQSK